MYEVLVAKTTSNFGLPATRAVYEKAIEVLPDKQTAEMCLRFAAMERKLGEIDRARAIYAHGSQLSVHDGQPLKKLLLTFAFFLLAAIPGSMQVPSTGQHGTLSRSRQEAKIRSERCSASSELFRLP